MGELDFLNDVGPGDQGPKPARQHTVRIVHATRGSQSFSRFFGGTMGIGCGCLTVGLLLVVGCVFLVGGLGTAARQAQSQADAQKTTVTMSPDDRPAGSPAGGKREPLPPNAVEQTPLGPDVEIRVSKPAIGKIALRDLMGDHTESEKDFLSVRIVVVNKSTTKKLEYDGAAGNLFVSRASLSDDVGNSYKAVHFGLGTTVLGQQKTVSIYPGEKAEDLYVFERPVSSARELVMRIQGMGLGRDKTFQARFHAPAGEK